MFLLAGCKHSAKHAVFWRRVEDVLFSLDHEKLLHSSPVLIQQIFLRTELVFRRLNWVFLGVRIGNTFLKTLSAVNIFCLSSFALYAINCCSLAVCVQLNSFELFSPSQIWPNMIGWLLTSLSSCRRSPSTSAGPAPAWSW